MTGITLKYVQRIIPRESFQDRQFFRCKVCNLKLSVKGLDVPRYLQKIFAYDITEEFLEDVNEAIFLSVTY